MIAEIASRTSYSIVNDLRAAFRAPLQLPTATIRKRLALTIIPTRINNFPAASGGGLQRRASPLARYLVVNPRYTLVSPVIVLASSRASISSSLR